MNTFFHLASVLLAPGSVIEPGNYGRMLRAYKPGVHDPWRLATELVFEQVRKTTRPDAVSRLGACFVFADQAAAVNERALLGDDMAVTYEVELVDDAQPRFVGDFSLMSEAFALRGVALPFLPRVEALATKYWHGEPAGTQEILTTSALRVLKGYR